MNLNLKKDTEFIFNQTNDSQREKKLLRDFYLTNTRGTQSQYYSKICKSTKMLQV